MRLRKRDPNALDAPMSPAELVAARETLGRTRAQFADDIEVTLYELEAMETGRKKVPQLVAVVARSHVLDQRQRDAMAASGLPECEEAKRIAGPMEAALRTMLDEDGGDTDAFDDARAAFDAHVGSCPTCRARRDFAERHGPPPPVVAEGPTSRALGVMFSLGDRLPGPLRVPTGSAGNGRRMGIGIAAMLSAFVTVIPFCILVFGALVRGRVLMAAQALGALVGMTVAYFVGFYLAGWAWDLTRPLRHRFVGYALRGALAWAAIYGVVALLMTLAGEGTLAFAAEFTLFMSGVGAVGGAAFWLWHRIRGKLPRPVAR